MIGRAASRRRRLERLIAEVWAEVLGVEDVGRRVGFLDLGGDSVAAMKVINRVEERLGEEVSVRALLETGTVAAMAAHLLAGRPELDAGRGRAGR